MTQADPLVTIVTPSYNQGRFIRDTIESVLTQDYPYIEYIIMDGGSTDETAEVVKPYLDRLTFISERDNGQSHAINKGFALAHGEIVAWLNSDDLYLPGAIRRAVDAFKTNAYAGVVYGEGNQIDEVGKLKQRFLFTQQFDLWKLVFLSDYILQQTVFFRKAAMDAVGAVREDLHFVMDWDILIRLGKHFEFLYIPEPLGALREYAEAKTAVGGSRRIGEIRDMLREHTGSWLPPGLIIYGLASFQRVLHLRVEPWRPPFDFFGKVLKKIAFHICYPITRRVMAYGQSWHRDGWAGPKIRVMLPEGGGTAIVRGMIPGSIPGLKTQTLTVKHRGREIARQTFNPGKFEMAVAMPAWSTRYPVLTIESSDVFVLSRISQSTDQRNLSLQLFEVKWAH
ncbi:MAG TPA: glycosyltransferase family 2 protein [Candidatus Baltobacteraceae bacterium]